MFNINKKNEVSLKDVDKVVSGWRNSREARGEIAVGLYGFVSIDPRKLEYSENHMRVFGEPNMLRDMLKFLKEDLDDRERTARNNEKCDVKHVHA